MAGKRSWRIVIIGAVMLLAGVAIWQLLPVVIDNLPTDIRGRIPEEILSSVMTPIPSALPPPLATPNPEAQSIQISISPTDILLQNPAATSTPEPQVSPTKTVSGQEDPVVQIPPTPTAAATRIPIPPQASVGELEVIAQKFNNCGPANLAMVLNFFGIEVDQLEVSDVLRPNADDRNVSPGELVAYVNNNSELMATSFFGGDRFLLKKLISQGYPVIVEKGLIPSDWQGWMGHYLTLYGYDDQDRAFLAMDTFLGPWDNSGRQEDYFEMERLWEHFNNAFIVIYPEAEEEIIKAIVGENSVRETSMWHSAVLKARQTLDQNPENAFAWFNLGASLTNIADISGAPTLYSGAALAFDQARTIGLPWRMLWYQFEPYRAYLGAGRNDEVIALTDTILSSAAGRDVEETYFYRSLALTAEGREIESDQALRTALRLNPNNQLLSESVYIPESIGD